MTRRGMFVGVLGLVALTALPVLHGCSPSKELSGTPVPNAVPDTRVTGEPPSLREASFVVHFYWSGTDPDGRLRGYQWKLSDNGSDGISVRDTLTLDPATGDTLNPWHYTASTDSLFVVKADQSGFPDDSSLDPRDRRSFQTHTFFVRAVDQNGAVDPTPAYVTFTSLTLVPTIIVDKPSLGAYSTSQKAPPTVTFGWTGTDPDFDTSVPVRVRYLWKPARYGDTYINSKYVYDQHVDEVMSFADSAWSDWVTYSSRPELRTVSFANQPRLDARGRQIQYFFAAQSQDTAGAVSVDRTYARTVHNVYIVNNLTPMLTVRETYLGVQSNASIFGVYDYDVAQNQPLDFAWNGSADGYAGFVSSYRYGWDVTDPNDENDPGWAVQPGNTAQHKKAPLRAFQSGQHSLVVQCWDNSNQLTRITIRLNVVPVPQPADQLPLLYLDDVRDRASNAWPDAGGTPLDTHDQRTAFWGEVLDPALGGVAGFDPATNFVETELDLQFGYRDIVKYRNVVWSTKKTQFNYIYTNFDPSNGNEKYVWMTTYHQQVGNVFLCGQQALQSFIGDAGMAHALTRDGRTLGQAPWITPVIFDTTEDYMEFQGTRLALGFGYRLMPDGTMSLIGRESYPYLVWGIAALDQASHSYFVYPGAPGYGANARKASCAGLKAIVLDPTFKSAYVDPGAIADTIYTARTVDWRDYRTPFPTYPTLADNFAWSLDEVYDTNLLNLRSTALVPQTLADGSPAAEYMWRYYSRYDWIDDMHFQREEGNAALHNPPATTHVNVIPNPDGSGGTIGVGWPLKNPDGTNLYTYPQLETLCGKYGLNLQVRSIMRNSPVGLLSHKTELTKPFRRPDVLWGFDPSRFDRPKIKQAIRWVLREQFGLRMSS